jgi:hypothetical protein
MAQPYPLHSYKDQTTVGPWHAQIQRLRFVLLFCVLLLSEFRYDGHQEFRMGDPMIIVAPPP